MFDARMAEEKPMSREATTRQTAPKLKLQDMLCYSVYSTTLAINRLYKPTLDALGLTYPQYLAMMALWERDGQGVKEIADALALDSSTLTPVLKRLEAGGLVSRRRSDADERQVVISVTEAGRALKDRAACVPLSLLTASGLEREDLVRLNEEIRALRDALVARAP